MRKSLCFLISNELLVHLSVIKVLLEVFLTPAKAVVASRTIFIFINEGARIVEIQIHCCRKPVSPAKKVSKSWNLHRIESNENVKHLN